MITFKLVCAWCGVRLGGITAGACFSPEEGPGGPTPVVSHGICAACAERELAALVIAAEAPWERPWIDVGGEGGSA